MHSCALVICESHAPEADECESDATTLQWACEAADQEWLEEARAPGAALAADEQHDEGSQVAEKGVDDEACGRTLCCA